MHIVMVGYGRSGTSLLYSMMRNSMRGVSFYDGELPALKSLEKRNAKAGDKCTKRPMDLFRIEAIEERIHDPRWIVVLRDPRDCLCSKMYLTDDAYKLGWDCSWNYDSAQSGIIVAVPPHPGLVARDRAIDRVPNPLIVRYEDLLREPQKVQMKIARTFGLRSYAAFATFHDREVSPILNDLMNGKRPIDTDRIGNWRRHPERIRQQFKEAPELFEIVRKRGYERDDSWFDAIEAQDNPRSDVQGDGAVQGQALLG